MLVQPLTADSAGGAHATNIVHALWFEGQSSPYCVLCNVSCSTSKSVGRVRSSARIAVRSVPLLDPKLSYSAVGMYMQHRSSFQPELSTSQTHGLTARQRHHYLFRTRMEQLPPLAANYATAIRLIDEAHAQDPRTVPRARADGADGADGDAVPYELHYARKMTRWLAVRKPDASPALQLACRAQHFRRFVPCPLLSSLPPLLPSVCSGAHTPHPRAAAGSCRGPATP